MSRTLRVTAAALLLLALANMPYGYYSFLRVAVTVAAVEVVWSAMRHRQWLWIAPFLVVAVLWNPLVVIHASRASWRWLDAGAAVLFLVSLNVPPPSTTIP